MIELGFTLTELRVPDVDTEPSAVNSATAVHGFPLASVKALSLMYLAVVLVNRTSFSVALLAKVPAAMEAPQLLPSRLI